jgi:transcriptional regulator with XRE-family HTH domain
MPRRYSRGDVAPHLQDLRQRAGLTQFELSARANVAIASIRRLEAGKKANVSTLRKLADALGVSYSQLTTSSPS